MVNYTANAFLYKLSIINMSGMRDQEQMQESISKCIERLLIIHQITRSIERRTIGICYVHDFCKSSPRLKTQCSGIDQAPETQTQAVATVWLRLAGASTSLRMAVMTTRKLCPVVLSRSFAAKQHTSSRIGQDAQVGVV